MSKQKVKQEISRPTLNILLVFMVLSPGSHWGLLLLESVYRSKRSVELGS